MQISALWAQKPALSRQHGINSITQVMVLIMYEWSICISLGKGADQVTLRDGETGHMGWARNLISSTAHRKDVK